MSSVKTKLSYEQINALGLKKGMSVNARSASGRFVGEIERVSNKKGKVKVYTGRHTESRDIRYYEISIRTDKGTYVEETFYEITIV